LHVNSEGCDLSYFEQLVFPGHTRQALFGMVRLKYQGEIENLYEEIKLSSCGRQACSVVIFIANEVQNHETSRFIIIYNDKIEGTINNSNQSTCIIY
jgi:hypothetical protein